MNAIEINDLIVDAIANAAERRHQTVLSDLSPEESAQIEGGLLANNYIVKPIILGRWINPIVLPILSK